MIYTEKLPEADTGLIIMLFLYSYLIDTNKRDVVGTAKTLEELRPDALGEVF